MTITADQVSLPIDKPDVDQRPGSSDVAWAERAYHHEQREATNERRRAPRVGRRRSRTLLIALAALFSRQGDCLPLPRKALTNGLLRRHLGHLGPSGLPCRGTGMRHDPVLML